MRKKKKPLLISCKILQLLFDMYKNGNSRKWYIINHQNNGEYGKGNENDSTIKFEMKVITSNLCDYSEAYILVTGNIKVVAMLQILMLHLKILLHLQDV